MVSSAQVNGILKCRKGAPPHVCTIGPNWSAKVSPTSDQWSGLVSIAPNTWIATGHGQSGTTPTNTIISTDNGNTWSVGSTIPNFANNTPIELRYGNGILLEMMGPRLARSTDNGATWASGVGSGLSNNAGLIFGNGIFVRFGQTAGPTNSTVSSPDGITETVNGTPAQFVTMFWTGLLWLGFELAGTRIWSSPDLITWTLRGNISGAAFAGSDDTIDMNPTSGAIVYLSHDTHAIVSTDGGLTWARGSGTLPDNSPFCMKFGNGAFLCLSSLGGAVYSSFDDGQTWALTSRNLPSTKSWQVRWDGNNTWVGAGGSGSNDTQVAQGIC